MSCAVQLFRLRVWVCECRSLTQTPLNAVQCWLYNFSCDSILIIESSSTFTTSLPEFILPFTPQNNKCIFCKHPIASIQWRAHQKHIHERKKEKKKKTLAINLKYKFSCLFCFQFQTCTFCIDVLAMVVAAVVVADWLQPKTLAANCERMKQFHNDF